MNTKHKSQGTVDPLEVKKRMIDARIKQKHLARELRRNKASVSLALTGKRPKLLNRINRYLNRIERNRGKSITASR